MTAKKNEHRPTCERNILTYGSNHSLDGEEGCEVGGVGRYDDESEEPPDPAHDPC